MTFCLAVVHEITSSALFPDVQAQSPRLHDQSNLYRVQPLLPPPHLPLLSRHGDQIEPFRPPPPPAADIDDTYEDDEIDPDVLDALDQIETRAAGPPKPAKLAARDLVEDSTKRPFPIPLRSRPTWGLTLVQHGKATSTLVPDIGLSPIRAHQHDFDFTWDSDESEAFRAFGDGPNEGAGTVAKANAGVHAMKPDPEFEDYLEATLMSPSNVNIAPSWGVRPKVRSTTSNGSSLEPLDSFSMDVEFGDDFLARVEEVERQALALTETSFSLAARHTRDKGKGKASLIPLSPPNRATRPVSNSVRTRSSSDARDSSVREEVSSSPPPLTQLPRHVRGSPHPPPSTQSKPTKRHLARDPTVIVVSSSDSENGGGCAEARFESEWADLGISGQLEDVIDISD
ncbi:hypothetical protein EDD15DRAFT_2376466 [Pisolithus albus]|nr:hypothetical protein EDD15DRAFT_2376466 [Pisolithus albus]